MSRYGLRLLVSTAGALVWVVWALAALTAPVADVAQAAARMGHFPAARAASVPFTITLQLVESGLGAPVHLTHAGDGSGRLFVVEQEGRIRIIENGSLLGASFLDISNLVLDGGERGLLSVAFDPDYETNGTFYVNYTADAGGGDTVIARYVVADPAADVANVVSVTPILVIDQPQDNHNGGQIQFGVNDDYLYIGMGDGGASNDQGTGHAPEGNGQTPGALLGKLLRIDVRGVPTYTIPPSNPFTQTVGFRPEIWARGLRNPWRFSFDRMTGDAFIGDVGQGDWEEIDYQPASSGGGENYGWRIMEGNHCFNPSSGCNMSGLVLPVAEYNHGLGCSVTGGYVYRGSDYPWLSGVYFYADYCSGRIWSLEQTSPGVWASVERRNESFNISSFGEGEDGELYVLGHSNGRVYKLTSTAAVDLSASTKSPSAPAPLTGEVVTYTISLRNVGGAFANTVRLTDTLPAGMTYVPGSLAASLGSPDDSAAPTLTWNGVMSNAPLVTVTYAVTITETLTQTLTNIAAIHPGFAAPFTRTASVVVNGLTLYVPIVLKDN
jgi:uncharacterized repeat protein (TIGR01451 family)